MTKEKWIAVSVGIIVVAFFLFGGTVMELFNGGGINTDVMETNNQGEVAGESLAVTDLVIGTGEVATAGSLVTVHYTGSLANGQTFDSSLTRGEPFEFTLGRGAVIAGWDLGLEGMKVGGKRRLVIPPALGYGVADYGPIPGNSTLVFEVELLRVEK